MKHDKWTQQGLVPAMVFVILAISLLVPKKAIADDPPRVARLSGIIDDTFILGKDDVEWSYAEPNLIVEEGDLLQTNETGRAEVHFKRGLVFRIGEGTRIAVIEMGEQKVVGMDNGRAYVRIAGEPDPYDAFILTFPTGQLSAVGTTLARIDVFEDGRAELNVIRGSIDLETTADYGALVHAGERVLINSEGLITVTGRALARRDDFDVWNEERDIALSTYRRPAYIEEDIVGAEELDGYGEWVYVERFSSYGWRPYVVKTWRPYYDGHWYYSTRYGWTWIPVEPWGYVTYHYGSWDYDPFYGWIWVPGYAWRPAHVSWVVYDDYVAWVPIGYYGYPVITTYPYHVSTVYVSYIDTFSFVFALGHHFHHHHGHHRHDWHHDGHHGDHHGRHGDLYEAKAWSDLRHNGPKTIAMEKIKQQKVRFQKNLEDDNLKKRFYKGKMTRERIDYAKMLDTGKHPELNRKIAKLEKWRDRSARSQPKALSSTRPKKAERDNTKTLDFRRRLNKRDQGVSADRSRRSVVTDASRRTKKENRTVQRSPQWRKRDHTRSGPATDKLDNRRDVQDRWRSGREIENRQSTVTKTDRVRRMRVPSAEDAPAAVRKGNGENGKRAKTEQVREIVRSGDSPEARARQAVMRRSEKRVPTKWQASRTDRKVKQLSEERVQVSRKAPQVDRGVVTGKRVAPVRQNQPNVGGTARRNAKPMAAPPKIERASSARRFENAVGRQQQVRQMRRQDAPAARTKLQGPRGKSPADSWMGKPRRETNSRGRPAAVSGGRGRNRR
jgi:hypothetical protein